MQALSGIHSHHQVNQFISDSLEDALLCLKLRIALESAFAAPTLFPRMRGSRLLRHGAALYCRNTTVCTVESAHTTGASTQQHYTYRVQRHVNRQILPPRTSPLAGNSGITITNTMT